MQYEGETVDSQFILPLSSLACTGTCATPPTTWFSVPLSIEGTPVEMCGNGMRAPCDPADARGAVGAANVRVDWVAGARNGLDDWQVGSLQREDVEHELKPLPQMDWLVTPTVSVAESNRSATIQFPLKVDRPVDYTAEAITLDSAFASAADSTSCERSAVGLHATGRALPNRGVGVILSGACLGTWYEVVVTLTDDDGNTNSFGMGSGVSPWPDARVKTPGIQTGGIALWYDVALEEAAGQLKIVQLRVSVDGQEIDPLLPERDCAKGASFGRPAGGPVLPDAVISERVQVTITMQLAVAYGTTDADQAYCNAGWDDASVYTLSAVISPDDLFGPVTITLPDDAPYTGAFTLSRLPDEQP